MKISRLLGLALLVSLGSACAKPPGQGYIDAFGHGSIAVMQVDDANDYPPLDRYDPSRYDFEDGAFRVDAKSKFSFRFFFEDGKTARTLREERGGDYNRYQVAYWSDSQPEAQGRDLPDDPLQLPEWNPIFASFTKLDDTFLGWQSAGFSWNDDVTAEIKKWVLSQSKPGAKMRIVMRFENAAPHEQGRYWNKATSMWVTPTLISYSEPFAGGTVQFR